MRSPADGRPAADRRRRIEWALRVVAFLLLALAVRDAVRPRVAPGRPSTLAPAGVDAAAAGWVAAGVPDSLDLTVDSLPGPAARAALVAARRAGGRVGWRGDSLVPLALALTPLLHPRGGTRLAVAAPAGTMVSLGDAAGPLDTVRAPGGAGATLTARATLGAAHAAARGVARASLDDSASVRRVLVVGPAGWEAKFAIAALEEDGWRVDARLAVAPGVAVAQGSAASLDTATHSAAVVIDSVSAADAARVVRFARSGGGVVLAGIAARSAAFAPLAPGGVGQAAGGALDAIPAARPLRGLTLQPVVALRSGAVVLERDERGAAVAARRVGVGRVVQAGYRDSWRWRLEGASGAPAAHRAWWSALVSAVAYAPATAVPPAPAALGTDPAPYAGLVDALGPPTAPPRRAGAVPGPGATLARWPLFLAILALLLLEWASRRARGAR